MLQEFKKFVMRGNVVDLAVGVVMGAAFGAVVSSIVANFINPLIAAIAGKPNFSSLHFIIHRSTFRYGLILNALVSFVLIAAAIFFFVVKPLNHLTQRMRTEESPDPSTQKCPHCLSEIPVGARRCAFCTEELAAA